MKIFDPGRHFSPRNCIFGSMSHRFSRRNFLTLPAAIPFAAFAGRAIADNQDVASGLVDLSLEASESWVPIGGRQALLYAFNGSVPGPVVEARPGDTVRIDFRNNLREATNLHFHGLHISPSGAADNSLLMVDGGESVAYDFTLPNAHPGGTFWIHPHVHGTSARQVSRGLAMPFIVRGELDAIPEVQSAPEFVLVLQDFNLNANGVPLEPSNAERMTGREGNLIAVSGQLNATIPVQQDGWVRLRLINASSSRFYRLQMEEHPLYQIASDGGALPAPQALDELLLVPGERAEVMIQASRPPGSYRLLNLPYDRGGSGMMGRPGNGGAAAANTLLTLVYDGKATQRVSLPSRLVSVAALTGPSRIRTFDLNQGMGSAMQGGMAFTINGRTFSPQRIDTQVALNEVEDWEFNNPTTMDHPMHIHTNPFQVIGADGVPIPAWKDVVLVPARSRVRVRTAFRDFLGRAMYHCHILDHEDLGMMGTVQFNDQ